MEEEEPVATPNENNHDDKSNVDLDKFREYLIGLRNHYGPYHERKEQIAWAAVTIYMTAIFAAIISIVNNFDKFCNKPATTTYWSSWSKFGLTVLLIGTAFLLWRFLKNEFKNRVFAAEMVRVVGELLAKLFSAQFNISVEEMECKKYQSPINGEKYIFPKIFCDHLDHKRDDDCEHFNTETEQRKIFKSNTIFNLLIFIWTAAITILIWLLPSF